MYVLFLYTSMYTIAGYTVVISLVIENKNLFSVTRLLQQYQVKCIYKSRLLIKSLMNNAKMRIVHFNTSELERKKNVLLE